VRRIEDSSFAVVANGFRGVPSEPLEEFLLERKCRRLVSIYHPLAGRAEGHSLQVWERGELVVDRTFRRPNRPPYTFPLDLVTPARPPAVDCWFGFNALCCWRGLLARRLGRARQVVYWCVDFVPERFGRGSPLTAAYERLDGRCCQGADLRVELSVEMLEARNRRHSGRRLGPAKVVPIGVWLERLPTTPPDGHRQRRLVYAGHLVPDKGGRMLIEAFGVLRSRGVPFAADVIGRGPDGEEMRRMAHALDLDGIVTFHGYVPDHRDVERLLAGASVGVAPYDPHLATFSRFADVAKLKSYLGAGLPIVVTEVPPNARRLEAEGAAQVVEFDAGAIADALQRVLDSAPSWGHAREASLRLREEFDWRSLLGETLGTLGYA
jgi:glycosyltransferase involved in cell wall biosynthesis